MKKETINTTMYCIIVAASICSLVVFFSGCKEKKEEPTPYYDYYVPAGYYQNLDRWGTTISVVRPDTSKLQLAIGTGTNIQSWFLRRYNNQAGYEWNISGHRIRFKKTDTGIEIVGDTLSGWKFKKQ